MDSDDKKLDEIDFSFPDKVKENYLADRYSPEAYKKLSILEKKALLSLTKSELLSKTITFAFNKASGLMNRLLPDFVPKDTTTKRLIASGATIWALDSWNPLSPVGEVAAVSCFSAAVLRGVFIHVKSKISSSHNTPKPK